LKAQCRTNSHDCGELDPKLHASLHSPSSSLRRYSLAGLSWMPVVIVDCRRCRLVARTRASMYPPPFVSKVAPLRHACVRAYRGVAQQGHPDCLRLVAVLRYNMRLFANVVVRWCQLVVETRCASHGHMYPSCWSPFATCLVFAGDEFQVRFQLLPSLSQDRRLLAHSRRCREVMAGRQLTPTMCKRGTV
jgi:hypothetical protein